MDKDHLVELITTSLFHEEKKKQSHKSYLAMKTYLQQLNLDQLRTMSKEFILQTQDFYKKLYFNKKS